MTNESEQRKMEGTLMGRLSPGARAQMTKHTSTEMELPKLHYLSMPLSSSQACHINSSYHCSQLARDCQHIFSCTILLPIGSNLFQTSERCHKYNPPQRYHITNQSNIFSVLLNLVLRASLLSHFPNLGQLHPHSSVYHLHSHGYGGGYIFKGWAIHALLWFWGCGKWIDLTVCTMVQLPTAALCVVKSWLNIILQYLSRHIIIPMCL